MNIAVIVVSVIVSVIAIRYSERHPVFGLWWFGSLTIGGLVAFIQALVQQQWGWAAWYAFGVVYCGFQWRDKWRRRKRKKALRALGNKARARIAAMVKRAREAAKPRPVFRPAPGGAR